MLLIILIGFYFALHFKNLPGRNELKIIENQTFSKYKVVAEEGMFDFGDLPFY